MLYINQYPRSGGVFLSHLSSFVLDTQTKVIRDPNRYSDDINQISVFRDPYSVIPSIIYRNIDKDFTESMVNGAVSFHLSTYFEFLESASKNINLLYIADFDSVMKNPVDFLHKVADRYSILKVDTENAVNKTKDLMINNGLASEKGGHIPRAMENSRTMIEEIVSHNTEIKIAHERFKNLMEAVNSLPR